MTAYIPSSSGGGGGAGHVAPGGNGSASGLLAGSGRAYGNAFVLPLLGGLGGAGGWAYSGLYGAGGGAGGGAILIASSDRIQVNGTIRANGGNGGLIASSGNAPGGGGGSSGSMRLIAPSVSVSGTLSANGGNGTSSNLPGGAGSVGRVRVEAFQAALTGSTGPLVLSTPDVVFLPSSRQPVRIVRVGDVLVPETPTGSLSNADVVLEADTPTTLDIAAHGVPPGTVVRVTVLFNSTDTLTFHSTPLSGTLASSTATAVVTIPYGFSQFLVEANWTP